MRFVIYGAGAIGALVGARLHQSGVDVQLVGRGAHLDAMRSNGLVVEDPRGAVRLDVNAVKASDIAIDARTVVLLAVKSHQTSGALDHLVAVAPPDLPIVCMQNGVENERLALRRFRNVYGVPVMCPAVHLEPGVVRAHAAPITGLLDIGRYPAGLDETAAAIAAVLNAATFDSIVRPDIQRWKYAKLLGNLGNAVEAVCGPSARRGRIGQLVRAEGEQCLEAAGIDIAPPEPPARMATIAPQPIRGIPRPGGSSWQSLQRGAQSIETDYLNGEIVLLGRLHGIPTPVNELLQSLCVAYALAGTPPGSMNEQEFLESLDALRD